MSYGRYYSIHNFAIKVSFGTCQFMTVIMAVYSESLWAFLESSTANESWSGCSSNGGPQEDKSTCNSTTKVSFPTIIISLSQCTMAIMTV